MNPSVKQVLEKLLDAEPYVKSKATLQLWLLLELSVGPIDTAVDNDGRTIYETCLPPHLLPIRLSAQEQIEVVEHICGVIRILPNDRRAKLFNVLKSGHRDIVFSRLLKTIHEMMESLDDSASLEAIKTLVRFLPRHAHGEWSCEVRAYLAKFNIVPLLERMLGSSNTDTRDIARLALDFIKELGA